MERTLHARLLHPHRKRRPVLAPGRYHLDLSVSVVVFDQPAFVTGQRPNPLRGGLFRRFAASLKRCPDTRPNVGAMFREGTENSQPRTENFFMSEHAEHTTRHQAFYISFGI